VVTVVEVMVYNLVHLVHQTMEPLILVVEPVVVVEVVMTIREVVQVEVLE
jgi:hypothetical protein